MVEPVETKARVAEPVETRPVHVDEIRTIRRAPRSDFVQVDDNGGAAAARRRDLDKLDHPE